MKSAPVRSALTNCARMTPIDWLPGAAPFRVREVGVARVAPRQVADDPGVTQVGTVEVGTLDDRGEEAGPPQVGLRQVGPPERGSRRGWPS